MGEDRDALVEEKKKDEEILNEEFLLAQKEKEEALVKAKIDPEPDEDAPKPEEGEEEEMSFETKLLCKTQIQMQFNVDLLTKEDLYKERFESLINRKIVKMENFIKSVFYLLEYKSEDVCEDNTQKLFWKKAKNHWNDKLLEKMQNYGF